MESEREMGKLYDFELQNGGGDVVDRLHVVRRYWLVAVEMEV